MSSIPLAFDTTPLHTVACNHPSSEPQENEPWEPGAKKPEKLARGSVVVPPLLELDKLANRAEEGHDPGRRWSAISGAQTRGWDAAGVLMEPDDADEPALSWTAARSRDRRRTSGYELASFERSTTARRQVNGRRAVGEPSGNDESDVDEHRTAPSRFSTQALHGSSGSRCNRGEPDNNRYSSRQDSREPSGDDRSDDGGRQRASSRLPAPAPRGSASSRHNRGEPDDDVHSINKVRSRVTLSDRSGDLGQNQRGRSQRGSPYCRRSSSRRGGRRRQGSLGSGRDSSTDGSDGAVVRSQGSRRHRIRPRTFDGSGSFETFWAHFENCAAYNRWDETDKLAHLKAALVGDTGKLCGIAMLRLSVRWTS